MANVKNQPAKEGETRFFNQIFAHIVHVWSIVGMAAIETKLLWPAAFVLHFIVVLLLFFSLN